MNEINKDSVGSKPTLKHIVVFEQQHEKINENVMFLTSRFIQAAEAEGIKVNKGKKYGNLPRQAEVVELFLTQLDWYGVPTPKQTDEYIQVLIRREKAKQAQDNEAV